MAKVDVDDVRKRLKAAVHQMTDTFVERDAAVACMLLAEVTRSNFILVGDPGTAKTALVKAWFSHCEDASTFKTLCGSFATEDKIFGPVDIKGFQAGQWGRVLKGRLAAVSHAFLDEMMKSNEGALNGMLTALNEREYEGQKIPLRVCGAASNWPEIRSRTENVAALWDRMLLRCHVEEVTGEAEVDLLEAAEKVRHYQPDARWTVAEIDAVAEHVRKTVAIGRPALKALVNARARLAKEKVFNSSRRVANLQDVLKATAWLAGRSEVTLEDFVSLEFGLWHDREQIPLVTSVLGTIDHDVVQACIVAIDGALRAHSSLQGLGEKRRLEEAPAVIKQMTDAARAVQSKLKEAGLTKSGRDKIAKQMAQLKTKFDDLTRETNAVLEAK